MKSARSRPPHDLPATRATWPARTAAGLSLAATPTFALMGLLAAFDSNGPTALLCGATNSFLDGMSTMYALMSVFHAGAWLRLVADHRGAAARTAE